MVSFDSEVYYEDIVEKVVKEEEINFLAFPMTKFHAVGVKASLLYLNSMGIKPRGDIYIDSHSVTGRSIDKNYFDGFFDDLYVTYGIPRLKKRTNINGIYNSYFKRISKTNKRLRIVYIICVEPIFILENLLKKIGIECIFICLDNGTATYTNPYRVSLCYVEIYGNNNKLVNFFDKCMCLLKTAIIQARIKKYRQKEKIVDFHIFKKIGKCLSTNEFCSKHYLEAFKINSQNIELKSFDSCVLINTQCFKENNMTDGIIDLSLYEEAIKIIKKYNSNIIIKTHPRECDCEKYTDIGGDVLKNTEYTQEDILASLDEDKMPKCIISISSSTLLNATGIFGIPAISLSKIFLQKNISGVMRKSTEGYIRNNQGIILFPESIEEFEELIKYYCK